MGLKKKSKESGGAPEWMVTFGDMMSLLLCFFVILVSMSELKQDQRYQDVMESIKRAFGYQGGVGHIPENTQPVNTNEDVFRNLEMLKFQLMEGQTNDQGIEGENPSVKMVREGLEVIIGGQVSFELGKAQLLDEGKKQLATLFEPIVGLNNKIRIKGHSARIPDNRYEPFANLYDLSYARACAVNDYLVGLGIKEERITLEACADKEPLRVMAYDDISRSINDRVSIVITENLMGDHIGAPSLKTNGIIDG
ncbi:MAG: OmpA family protein [Planctomycetes bacterium]|nr:OmpA family protein [Planctomycetota bacterium]